MLCLSVGLTVGLALGLGGQRGNIDSDSGGDYILRGLFRNRDMVVVEHAASQVAGDVDESPIALSPTPVPPQGRTPIAAAEDMGAEPERLDVLGDAASGSERQDAGGTGGAVLGVSYTPLGEIVAAYSWPINEAFAIVECESSWNPGAISWAGSRGLMQLMPVHAWRFTRRGWDYWTDVFVPERNVAIGYEIWMEQGWQPWDCW